MRGIQAVHSKKPKQAHPLQIEHLQQITASLDAQISASVNNASVIRGYRDKVLVLLGFWRGFRSDALREYIEARGGISVIPKRNYGQDIDKESVDWCLYKYRHLVENAFARIKHYRSISTRYEKLARNYASMVSLAFSMMWLPMYC